MKTPLELQKFKRWRTDEDRFLREWSGKLPLAELRSRMIADTGLERTTSAIQNRLSLLGLPCGPWGNGWYRLTQAAELLGVTGGNVWAFVQQGRLQATKHGKRWNAVSTADLEAFIRSEPLLLDPAKMPRSRFRDLLEVEQRVGGWLSVEQVAEYLGLSTRTKTGTVAGMCQDGRLPAVRGRRGSGDKGRPRWWIRRSDVLAYIKAREMGVAS